MPDRIEYAASAALPPLPEDWVSRYFAARLALAFPPPPSDDYAEDRPFDPAEAVDVAAFMAGLRRSVLAEPEPSGFRIIRHQVAPRPHPAPLPATPKRRVPRLAEFLRLSSADFIGEAYRHLLLRRPDPPGEALYLRMLQDGAIDRVELLWILQTSPEGQTAGVTVPGLARRMLWRKLARQPMIAATIRVMLRLRRSRHR